MLTHTPDDVRSRSRIPRRLAAPLLSLALLALGVEAAAQGQCTAYSVQPAKIEEFGVQPCICTLSIFGIGLSTDSVDCRQYTIETPTHTKCEGISQTVDCRPAGTVTVKKVEWSCKCSCSGPSISIGGAVFCAGSPKAKCKAGPSSDFGGVPNGSLGPCIQAK